MIHQVQNLTTITVRDQTVTIVYYVGGDWKFLEMVTGIGAATYTSRYACIWCKCPQLERFDTLQKWSIMDTDYGARTLEENIALAQSRAKEKFNVINNPIFPTIPQTCVVVDNLHMLLRVCDVLIDLLLMELRHLDCIDKVVKLKSLDSLKYIKLYEQTLQMIGIGDFSFWIGKESKKLKFRSLTCPEKLILFDKMKVAETFPQISHSEKVQSLWTKPSDITPLLHTKTILRSF